ncbi:MAG: glycine zipper 2TM domain-containing protein [Pseudomonadota bacterium]
MKTPRFALVCSASVLALTLGACSSSPPRNDTAVFDGTRSSSMAMGYGNVSNIEIVPVSARTSGGGAVLGAVIGGVLGNQVGSGSGRTAATVIGAVGGAAVGNQIEQRNKSDNEVYRVTVRLDSGDRAQFDYQRIDDLRVGDRVVVRDGQLHRA